MRQHPVGTGPFKFGKYKPNEYIKVVRNPNYSKKGQPYLDRIEYTIIRNLSTAVLALVTSGSSCSADGSIGGSGVAISSLTRAILALQVALASNP
jgi:ABC-type transport system substrate-binding protein